ncbi:peptide-methionine (S)-S-oxide reductase MsrA [Roseibium sediminicola]|uniref:Peptide methionine sulfoxide reductase MsrA n=1 Tax=Roseibium sediminicola TaxID=2933272 RepID=A0ABT0GXI8_9HYPH|nr:peptide-methionine (S)-S-oxide reductase MsrA [Roseibium sp. CAU 1639]MCK7614149.1 peptide-methionine (S)-S-oxide reductase MsrA [Roseibium sp. CAU 1639]
MSFMTMLTKKFSLPAKEEALPGRADAIRPVETHFVNGNPLTGPYPDGLETVLFGMGCFWGAERLFWQLPGVHVTAVGYAGGHTPNPTYHETCTGRTGHTEAVLVVYDPVIVSLTDLLKVFWENHDPTQGMRQGNDTGTQYRSAVYVKSAEDLALAETSRKTYQEALKAGGVNASITTEIRQLEEFFFAEDYHQQYLAKNPAGYCGIGGTGVSCPTGLDQEA